MMSKTALCSKFEFDNKGYLASKTTSVGEKFILEKDENSSGLNIRVFRQLLGQRPTEIARFAGPYAAISFLVDSKGAQF